MTLLFLNGCGAKSETANTQEGSKSSNIEDRSDYESVVQNYLKDGSYDEAGNYYKDYITQHPELKQTIEQVYCSYLDQKIDQYNKDELSESEVRSAISEIGAMGIDVTIQDGKFQLLISSKAAFQSGVTLLDAGKPSEAVEEFQKVIVEDTLYQTIVPVLYKKVEEYINAENYIPATIVYRRLQSVYGEDVTLKLADTYKKFGDYLVKKGSTDLAITAFGLSYSYNKTSEVWKTYSSLYASKHLIGIGCYDLVALKKDGTAMAVGRSGYAFQSENMDTSVWKNLIGVDASWEAAFGLTNSGMIVTQGSLYTETYTGNWSNVINMDVGYLDVGAVSNVPGTNGVLINNTGNVQSDKCSVEEFGMIYVGGDCLMGLRWDGTVAMLPTENGEKHRYVTQEDVAGWSNVASLFVNLTQVVAVKEDGTVYSAGSADLSKWTDIVKVTGSAGNFLLGLKKDGTVVSYSDENMWGADKVEGWTDIIDIATNTEGYCYTAGVRRDGTLVAVGTDREKELIRQINTMSGVGIPNY
jgi:hypothetical protein